MQFFTRAFVCAFQNIKSLLASAEGFHPAA